MSVRSAYCDICEAQRAFDKPEAGCGMSFVVIVVALLGCIPVGMFLGAAGVGFYLVVCFIVMVLAVVSSALTAHHCRTCGTRKFFWH